MIDRAAIISTITAAIAAAGPAADAGPIANTGLIDANSKVKTPASSDRVEKAKLMIAQLRQRGFKPYLDDRGVLMIADAYGKGRDVSWNLPVAKVFDDLAAGLDEDPGLLVAEEGQRR